jgi:transcriptional repressor NrdR
MICPYCQNEDTKVTDKRDSEAITRRRRECLKCEKRFTTFERIEESLPMVIKKGGQRESFDRYKVLSGMKRACEKRPVSVMDLEDAIKQIETHLIDSGEKEISSEVIGALVSEKLKMLDQVAYVRFASVYREFSDVQEFVETLNQLSDKKGSSVSNVTPISKTSRMLRTGQQLTLIEK